MGKGSLYFVGDFETTVYEGQEETEVWAAACVQLGSESVQIFHSIEELFYFLISIGRNLIIYFHNLKFDGEFWISYLYDRGFNLGFSREEGLIDERHMKSQTFVPMISAKGQWYRILIKYRNQVIEIRDSLKLLPISVKRLGDSFGTKHKKLDMVYEGKRYAGCEISNKEREYITNDVLVVKEALEIMQGSESLSLTIGSCCIKRYKRVMGYDFQTYFPDIMSGSIPEGVGSKNPDEYIRKAYRGGWTYVKESIKGKVLGKGFTYDVNSLYPSMMSSESGNYYPVGEPHWWLGNMIPDEALRGSRYFYIRIRCRFYLKKGVLPFVQIKNDSRYNGREMLHSSNIKWEGVDLPEREQQPVILTFTCTDYWLFLEHYTVTDFEILDGCWFYAEIGLFDNYINKYKKIKKESKGARREIAKLFLNNLYGKMSTNTDSSYKVPYMDEDRIVRYDTIDEMEKKPGYIPVGAAVTSYARCFTITHAQKNYNRFCYADTDSLHMTGQPGDVEGVEVSDTEFCKWKLESTWDSGIFVRSKTYIERVGGGYQITCAGMSQHCKDLLKASLEGRVCNGGVDFVKNEKERCFVNKRRGLEDFKIGLEVPGKIRPVRIKGGIILKETTFKIGGGE